MTFKRLNNITGWLAGLIATIVYFLTLEPTVSWWDCGEYISTAYKLQVGHPPGAPLFQMIGRFFSLFAGGDVTKVAMMVNVMSAICSGLTIVFLFWTITMMVQKVWMKEGEDAPWVNKIGVLLAGFVGAVAYTFTESFWFNAVEGKHSWYSCGKLVVTQRFRLHGDNVSQPYKESCRPYSSGRYSCCGYRKARVYYGRYG